MACPLLIDTDPGIDDAVAIFLALQAGAVDVLGMVGVGGNVSAAQATENIERLLGAAPLRSRPMVGCGLDPEGPVPADRIERYGVDGLRGVELTGGAVVERLEFREVYRRCIERGGGELHVLALGPLTNVAAALREIPEMKSKVAQVVVSGGAVWAAGAEFNFHRDPAAAAEVLSSGLNITVCPLDVTRLVFLDESHAAHLAAAGPAGAQVAGRLLRSAIEGPAGAGQGRCAISDVVAMGALLWPALFLKTRMRLEIETSGAERGRSKPALGGEPGQRVNLLTAVNALDFIENLLESMCNERFVV